MDWICRRWVLVVVSLIGGRGIIRWSSYPRNMGSVLDRRERSYQATEIEESGFVW